MINIKDIKQLRDQTQASVADCRRALEESGGDYQKALKWLKKRGAKIAQNKAGRPTGAGIVDTYIHHTLTSGATVVVGSETDFVARNREFQQFAHDIAQQVTATGTEQVDKLLNEPWIKDETKTIGDLLKEQIAKFGENITIQEVKKFEVKR